MCKNHRTLLCNKLKNDVVISIYIYNNMDPFYPHVFTAHHLAYLFQNTYFEHVLCNVQAAPWFHEIHYISGQLKKDPSSKPNTCLK